MGLRVIFNIERQVSKYLQGQLLAASSVALMSFIGLSILNLMGANLTLVVFIAIIAGLANLIPLVGPFAGMLPAILVAIMNNIGSDIAINHQIFNTIPSPFDRRVLYTCAARRVPRVHPAYCRAGSGPSARSWVTLLGKWYSALESSGAVVQ